MPGDDTIEMPALVAGALSLDFANSVDTRGQPKERDFLPDLPSFRAWCQHLGVPIRSDASDASISEVHSLREAVVTVALAAAEHRAPNPAALALLNRYVLPTRLTWTGHGFGLESDAPSGGIRGALSKIAHDTVDLLTGERRSLLKRCDRPGHCDWLFLDTTRNHTRRYCTEGCAVKERVHRHRRKLT
jgi:predicted RNA-binding Zn ribbon-like protein